MTAEGWRLRRGTEADLDSVLTLERGIREAPHWGRADYIAAVSGGGEVGRCLLVAEAGDELLGFAVGAVMGQGAGGGDVWGELESVAVAPGARRRGIGRELCVGVVEWCRGEGATHVELEVRSSSDRARSVYATIGFEEVGVRPGYYRDPVEDAVLMRLRL